MSGWLLMGLPGATFVSACPNRGSPSVRSPALTNWRLVAARLRLYTERVGNAARLPGQPLRGQSNPLRIVTALVILVFFTLYSLLGRMAGARLFENMFGMPYATGKLWWAWPAPSPTS